MFTLAVDLCIGNFPPVIQKRAPLPTLFSIEEVRLELEINFEIVCATLFGCFVVEC